MNGPKQEAPAFTRGSLHATSANTQRLHVPAAGPASGLGPNLAQPSAGAWPTREHVTAGRYRRGPDIDDPDAKLQGACKEVAS